AGRCWRRPTIPARIESRKRWAGADSRNRKFRKNIQRLLGAHQMSEPKNDSSPVTRRHFLSVSGAALAAATAVPLAAQTIQQIHSSDHHLPNEQQVGPNNTVNDSLNPDSVWPPESDNGTMLPFKYSFDLSHKEIDSGGWTRQVTVRDLAISKTMAGVEMRPA